MQWIARVALAAFGLFFSATQVVAAEIMTLTVVKAEWGALAGGTGRQAGGDNLWLPGISAWDAICNVA